MVDFGKSINASIIPTVVYVILGSIVAVIESIPLVNIVSICCLILPKLAIGLLILGWSGYIAVKKKETGLGGAALAGAFSGAAGLTIVAIVTLMLQVVGFIPSAALGTALSDNKTEALLGGALQGLFGGAIGIFAIIFYFFTGIIIGSIMGLIGGFVAGKPDSAGSQKEAEKMEAKPVGKKVKKQKQ